MARHPNEAAVVRDKFPSGTRQLTVGGVTGWAYSFRCQEGDPYQMFIYWDGSLYMVKLVHPAAERASGSAHDKHLFRDGKICLRQGTVGLPDFAQAYSKSTMWATGYSIFRKTGRFPFAITNQ